MVRLTVRTMLEKELILEIQIVRFRSKNGTARYEFQPSDDISVLLKKVGAYTNLRRSALSPL